MHYCMWEKWQIWWTECHSPMFNPPITSFLWSVVAIYAAHWQYFTLPLVLISPFAKFYPHTVCHHHIVQYKYRVEVQILSILFNSSIDFDKDQDFFAVGGVTRQLKVYEYNSVVTRPVSVHYPVQDMGCGSKIRYALE